jgi:hypothetical protein
LAAYLLTLGAPIGHFGNGHVLLIVRVLVVPLIVITALLERILDEFFIQNCTGAIPGANSVAGRHNNQPLVREFIVRE